MRTNIVIDDKLMERAMEVTGLKTKREVVAEGLRALVDRPPKTDIMELWGTGKDSFADDFDYKEWRGTFRDYD